MVYAPTVMNSPCAMLMTPIWPKMMASPKPISSSTANRLRPAKPCINPILSISEKVMWLAPGKQRVGGTGLAQNLCPPGAEGYADLLVALGERIRFDQLRRLGHNLE